MGNTQPIKGSGATPPVTPREEPDSPRVEKVTVNFEAVALGETVGSLTAYDKPAPRA
jgi:hypothetical protein